MKHHVITILTLAVISSITAFPASAEGRLEGGRGEGGRGEGRHSMKYERHWDGERDIRHFEDHHLSMWRSGRWVHDRHEGRFGWWWIAAGSWYFYPGPIYPYPDPYLPPVLVIPNIPQTATSTLPPQAQSWYYCEASKSYYPYVSSCPAGWKTVPATPQKAPTSLSKLPPSDSSASQNDPAPLPAAPY